MTVGRCNLKACYWLLFAGMGKAVQERLCSDYDTGCLLSCTQSLALKDFEGIYCLLNCQYYLYYLMGSLLPLCELPQQQLYHERMCRPGGVVVKPIG